MRVPRRARLAEVKSADFLLPSLVVLFVALGGENSAGPRSAMRQRAVGGSRERKGRGSCAARDLHWCRSVSCA
eukprot:6209354-Pleurochrysis_carterae.AAC.2